MQPELIDGVTETWEEKTRRLALKVKRLRVDDPFAKGVTAKQYQLYRLAKYELELHLDDVTEGD